MNGQRVKEAIEYDLAAQVKAGCDQPGLCSSTFGPSAVGAVSHCLVGAMAIYYAVQHLKDDPVAQINGQKVVRLWPEEDEMSIGIIVDSDKGFREFYGITRGWPEIDAMIAINDRYFGDPTSRAQFLIDLASDQERLNACIRERLPSYAAQS